MAAFPPGLCVLFDTSETPETVVLRSEMERGIPKQRRFAADARITMPISVVFYSAQEAKDFDDWFYGDIGAGTDFFDFVDPRSGQTVQARIVGGELGPLVPLRTNFAASRRSMVIEFYRSAI